MTNRKIKILFVYPASDLGGAAQFILPIVRFLPRDRFEIHVAVFGNGPLYELLRREHFVVHDLKIDYSIFSFLQAIKTFKDFLGYQQYDLIHAHTAKGGLLCCVAARGLFTKIIYTGHVFMLPQTKPFPLNILYSYIERFIYHSAAYVTVLSEREYACVRAAGLLDPAKIGTVSMSIDTERFSRMSREDADGQRKQLGIPLNAFIVGMVGRLTSQKDPELFVDVAAALLSHSENMHFIWVGDGDLRERITRKVTLLGIEDKFTLTGQQSPDEMPKLLSVIDVLLFTSKFEGLPISLLEAMAAKKFIVAVDVGCVSDVIVNGVTGWLFDPGDYKKGAASIENIHSNRERYDGIRHSAFDLVVNNFSPKEKMGRQFQNIYDALVN